MQTSKVDILESEGPSHGNTQIKILITEIIVPSQIMLWQTITNHFSILYLHIFRLYSITILIFINPFTVFCNIQYFPTPNLPYRFPYFYTMGRDSRHRRLCVTHIKIIVCQLVFTIIQFVKLILISRISQCGIPTKIFFIKDNPVQQYLQSFITDSTHICQCSAIYIGRNRNRIII